MKIQPEALSARLADCPQAGSRWRHYRSGGVVTVTGAAVREEDLAPLVLYEHDGVTFARPLSSWQEVVAMAGNAQRLGLVRRFEPVEESP